MGWKMELSQVYDSIDFDLTEVDKEIQTQLLAVCSHRQFVDKVLRFFFQTPGKKLRPSLTLMSAFALRGDNMATVRRKPAYRNLVTLAALTELVHSASLMHDDVLDDAETRRGIPSLNAKFGNRIAILAGDILYSHAFELLAGRSDRKIFMLLARCVRQMCRGEITNLFEHDFTAYRQIIEDKTACFMAFCCEAGALSVADESHDPEHIKALSRFGNHFGMVYQLYDDLGDCDDATAMGHRDMVVGMLDEHISGAREALACLPRTEYVAKLGTLLDYVVSKSEPSLAVAGNM